MGIFSRPHPLKDVLQYATYLRHRVTEKQHIWRCDVAMNILVRPAPLMEAKAHLRRTLFVLMNKWDLEVELRYYCLTVAKLLFDCKGIDILANMIDIRT